jgi:hypothetical protein
MEKPDFEGEEGTHTTGVIELLDGLLGMLRVSMSSQDDLLAFYRNSALRCLISHAYPQEILS